MLNALRAALLLLVLVATARAGESLNPPAPRPQPCTWQEPSGGETPDDGTGTLEASAVLADAALELLAILPALV